MNQLELNHVALRCIQMRIREVGAKLTQVLCEDREERARLVSGPLLHYIHNMALFDCFAALNAVFAADDHSAEDVHQYIEYAETLRPKFIDLMEELQDFRPVDQKHADDEHRE